MISSTTIETMINAFAGVYKDYPFGDGVAVYKIAKEENEAETSSKTSDKMFAIIAEGSSPVRLSLKCDPGLAELLREKYETVLPGYHLNKRHWNTIICSGQVPDDELRDLIRHSYELVQKKP